MTFYLDDALGVEQVVNGDGSTTAGWVPFNGGTLTIVNSAFHLAGNGVTANPTSSQALPNLVVGKTYQVTITFRGGTAIPILQVWPGSGAAFFTVTPVGVGQGGTFTYTFVPTDAGTSIWVSLAGNSGYAEYSNVSVREVVAGTYRFCDDVVDVSDG